MARRKSYDRDVALRRACEAFWAHGYGALGVRAIEDKTGLNQFAIQTEFGGKEGLLIEAMEFYARSATHHALAPMRAGGVETIIAFFRGLVTDGSPMSSRWGCLLVNSGIENAEIKSARIGAVADAYWRTLKKCFAAALRRSIAAGELVRDLDVGEASAALVSAVVGIHTSNRIAASNRAGLPLVRMIEAQIVQWRR